MNEELTDKQTSNSGITLRHIAIPSIKQTLIYLLISLLILILISGWPILEKLSNLLADSQNLAASMSQDNLFTKISKKLIASRVPEITFGLFIGCSLYAVFWFVRNIAINIRNDVVADKYFAQHHIEPYNRFKYWWYVIYRKFLFGFSMVIFLIYLFACLKFFPVLANLSYTALSEFELGSSSLIILSCVVITAVIIHILFILAHLVVKEWHRIHFRL